MRTGSASDQRVAVRRGLGNRGGANGPACTSPVFDDDVGAGDVPDRLGCEPPHQVGTATGYEGYDHADLLGWIGILLGAGSGHGPCEQSNASSDVRGSRQDTLNKYGLHALPP